ncbi:MAG: arsenate reductase ArsC [Bacteroidales bacterium]|nr:arsenate reductase ArsC [Bacteroidales bacterium]
MKILILCTGNSCRSQMAEGVLKALHPQAEVFSAGTKPEKEVNPHAVRAMAEMGIDISHHKPDHVDRYVGMTFDYVITVCDHAKEVCPIFTGEVKYRLHIPFEDPADARGTDVEVMLVYRKVRDSIKDAFENFKM